jgi:hypothetical protein
MQTLEHTEGVSGLLCVYHAISKQLAVGTCRTNARGEYQGTIKDLRYDGGKAEDLAIIELK